MKTLPNLLAIIAASATHVLSGFFLTSFGRVNTRIFSETDMELPHISKALAAYTSTVAPIIVGLLLGFVTLTVLVLINRSEHLRYLLSFLISVSFVVVLLQIAFVSFGLSLPLVRMVEMMAQ